MNTKVALITAASSKIGSAIALALSVKGYDIAIQYLNNHDAARELKQLAEQNGARVKLLSQDLTREQGAHSIVKETVEAFGRVDLLVNTIGPCEYQNLLEATPKEWEEMITMNLNSVFNVIYNAKEHLIETKGHIITFGYAGVDLLKARSTLTAYCAAKAGLVILTRSLASEFGRHGVRVNMVCPGWIDDTPHSEERMQEILQQIPFGRMGTVTEVAEVVTWLVEQSPEYVTGAIIPVAGASEH